MATYLQPCDWIEHDVNYKYIVDVFGRTNSGDVAKVRLTGFKPYVYIKAFQTDTPSSVENAIHKVHDESQKKKGKGAYSLGLKISRELKQDAMQGFSGMKPIPVWKIVCKSLFVFKTVARLVKSIRLVDEIYESDLPPLLRLFHEQDIAPASPLVFDGTTVEVGDDENVDISFEVEYSEVRSFTTISIPLLVGSYDIEVYSSTGKFPVSSNAKDEITQIGISFRWNDTLLESESRFVFVNGTCEPSNDPTVQFVECRNEKDLLQKFAACIRSENPDIICGYNTFGFDDGYLADRAEKCQIGLDFGRVPVEQFGKSDFIHTEKKTFEVAAGKFALRYITMPGRMSLDLYLIMRREQNLDSYKLDNIANKFLRDKVSNIVEITREKTQLYEIHTKNTRGLFAGNLVRFDIITNTSNPYKNGQKFLVKEVFPKKFIVELPHGQYLFADLNASELKKLEWSFAKDDVDHHDIFAAHVGSSADRSNIAKYCIQDCDLVLTLIAKLDTLVNARGMADVCRVPVQYTFLRGQGIKIYSAVVYNASKRNQVIMTQDSVDGDASYEGAIVLPPRIGMYLDQPIPVLDFNSLYPSNMIAYNLSPDTLVYVKKFNEDGEKTYQYPTHIPDTTGFKVDEISYDEKDSDGSPIGRVTCGFAQPTDDGTNVGLLPQTLDTLLKKRKETRKMMEKTDDDAQKSVLNGLQLAYKVVANSVYGQCGSRTSPIRNMYVAACTTALGRNKIRIASDVVVGEFGAEVIYGDSVASYTPLMLRVNGVQTIMSAEELGCMGEWKSCSDRDKEFCDLNGVESWTDGGWVNVERIIRHRLASHKKMIRVLTHTALVDVTDDHSLLKQDGTEVSSKDLSIGDSLLHTQHPSIDYSIEGDIVKARIAGFFVGDGSCGVYECPSGEKASWALNNANIDLLNKYKHYCEQVYTELDWVLNPTLLSSGVYKLAPVSKEYGSLKRFVESYRELYYVGKRKNLPSWIMNGSIDVQRAFWDGFYDADGDKDLNGYIRIDQKHQTTCAQLALLGSHLGYNVSLNTRIDKPQVTRLTFTKSKQRLNPCGIKKMYEVEYSGYVYDLTTSNHHFQAGVGKMIVHNTDSIFVKFPTKDLAESIKLGQQAAELITQRINRKPYKIEYEKTLYPFILFCRKRYVGMLYEDNPTATPKRKEMGIALKRRDSAPIVKDIFGGALDILMEERDIRKAQRYVMDKLSDVLQNRIPLEKFIITKQLSDNYAAAKEGYEGKATLPAHVVLANRMKERDPGSAPQVGDRVPFLYVNERKNGKKQGDRIEHLDYVIKNKLTPDAEFYVTNQIQNPVAQMFALALESLEGYKPRTKYANMLRGFIDEKLDEEEATLKVLDKKEKEIDELMFQGIIKKYRRGPMDMFVKR